MIHHQLKDKLPEIIALFKANKVKRAYAFGSVCTEKFNDKSDVDFVIAFEEGLEPLQKGENWWNLFYQLKNILKRDVDLLTEDTLKNPYFIKSVNKTKTALYE
jgi:predicted nucleotidyltransferase